MKSFSISVDDYSILLILQVKNLGVTCHVFPSRSISISSGNSVGTVFKTYLDLIAFHHFRCSLVLVTIMSSLGDLHKPFMVCLFPPLSPVLHAAVRVCAKHRGWHCSAPNPSTAPYPPQSQSPSPQWVCTAPHNLRPLMHMLTHPQLSLVSFTARLPVSLTHSTPATPLSVA